MHDADVVSLEEPKEPWAAALDLVDPGRLKQMLEDIYDSSNWPSDEKDEGNRTEPPNARLPSSRREGDATRPASPAVPPVALTKLHLSDPKLTLDTHGLTLSGRASARLVLPTAYPLFDTPTNIDFTVTSVQPHVSETTIRGGARAYKVIRADWTLHLHYDVKRLLHTAFDEAKRLKIDKETLAKMLSQVSFDASAIIKVGFVPLSMVKVSASSLMPMSRPLMGALDRLLPVQIAALPDSELFMGGMILLPPGVVFDTTVPGFGLHYSKYGTRTGYSGTLGGVTKPNLGALGSVFTAPGKAFPIYGYADFHYVRRISDTFDLGIGLTYAYSATVGGSDKPDRQELHYLEAEYSPWLPASRENTPPEEARSKHRVMFQIEGTFDWFGSK